MGSWTPRGVRPEERCERWAPGASGGVAGTQVIKASRRRRRWAQMQIQSHFGIPCIPAGPTLFLK